MGTHLTILLKPEYKIEQLVKEIINCPEPQIVIKVPDGCDLLTNEINLRLLKFYAEEEEKEIIINSVDATLTGLAQRLGISTIRECELADQDSGPEFFESHYRGESEVAATPEMSSPEIEAKKNFNPNRLLPAFVLLIFTLILAVWWFFQPQAVLLVYPKEQMLSFKANAQISSSFSDADIPQGKIPAKSLEKLSTLVVQNSTSGHKIIGVTPAIGKVLIINSSNQPVMLPKGSILYSKDGIRFLTDKDVLVPKKFSKLESGITVGENYGRVEVNITAEKKGIAGNLPAKAIMKIDNKYGFLLTVINPAPTRNGSDKQIAIVTLDDVYKGQDEAKRQMQLAVDDEARSLINKDYLYIADLVKAEIIHFTNKPAIGEEGESVQTELQYRVAVLAPTAVGVKKFLLGQFDRNIPANFEAENQKIDLVSLQVISKDEEVTSLALTGQGQIRGILNQYKIKNLIRGKTIAAAQEILNRQNEIANVKFQTANQGTRLPSFGFQIKIIFPAGSKTNKFHE